MVLYSLKAVKFFKTLTDRQSCLFCKSQKSKKKKKNSLFKPSHILIKKSQTILKRFLDLKFSVRFTLG